MSLFPSYLAWALSAVFAVAAALHLLDVKVLREAYRTWRYPRGFRVVTGTLLALAAALIAYVPTRPFGLAVATLGTFLSATTLLSHRQYSAAAPVIALLFALIPFSLAAATI